MTPTARSLKHHRALGHVAEVVEKTIRLPGGRVFKRDLWGFGDVLIMDGLPGSLIVQCCVTGDQSKRLAKIQAEPHSQRWLSAGNRVVVEGWAKRGPRGKRKVWTLSVTSVFHHSNDLPASRAGG